MWRSRSRSLRREHRQEALWQRAHEDAVMVLNKAREEPGIVIPAQVRDILDISKATLEACVQDAILRAGGGRCYVGSTSDPTWRWLGGWTWRSDPRAAEPPARASRMEGHKSRWRQLLVVGAFPDARAAALEPIAIEAARRTAGQRVTDVASDARGLSVRSHPGYSFLYLCTD